MNKMRLPILTILALIGLMSILFGTSSCIKDDFTTSQTDLLTFSRDTVSFDTVFTDLGTPTARLLVYNKAKKSINISEIKIEGEEKRFRLNVDGMAGDCFRDVEIRGGDSIYVFVECFIKETENSNKPALVEDKLQFVTNGVTQSILLEAWGRNVKRLRNHRITTDTHLTAEMPYVIFDSLVVDKGVTLTVDAGTQLLFHDKASLTVYGCLQAIGQQGNPIDFRGDRLDNVLPDTPYDILAGQWGGVTFKSESYDNRMEFVNMRSTSFGVVVDSCAHTDQQKLLLLNSWLHNSQGNVLRSKYARVDAYGCCFSEAADNVVSLTGGVHNFVHCTIANYYLFASNYEPLLGLYHCLPDKSLSEEQPLMTANFENCIIYGMQGDINEGDLTGSNVFLRNVLLGAQGSDDDNFISCIWGMDPLFYTVREDYIFNYRLRTESPAIAAGNPDFITHLCSFDMDGHNRLSNGNPDLGAFVFVANCDEK